MKFNKVPMQSPDNMADMVALQQYYTSKILRLYSLSNILLAWSKLLVLISRVTADYVWGVVGGHTMVCEVIHTYQMLHMPHITLIQQWDSISIPVLLSLYHYTTDEVHGHVSSSLYHYTTNDVHGLCSCFQYPG